MLPGKEDFVNESVHKILCNQLCKRVQVAFGGYRVKQLAGRAVIHAKG